MYIRYLRRRGVPFATVVGLPTEDGGTFGLSLCSKSDSFTKSVGRHIAAERARKQARMVDDRADTLPDTFDSSLLEIIRTRLQSSLRGPDLKSSADRKLLAEAIGSIMDQRDRVESKDSALAPSE